MAQVVVLPQLGNTVESCVLTEWLVAVGDDVTENTEVATIETDKSSMEVPAGASGVVLALLAEEGDEVPVKAPFLVVGEAGENVEQVLAEAGLAPQATGEAGEVDESEPDDLVPSPDPEDVQPEAQGSAADADAAPAAEAQARSGDVVGVSPRARATAERVGVDAAGLAGSGPGGRVIERDVLSADAPAATRGAAAAGGERPQEGTGLGGRVTTADLAAAASGADEQPATQPAATRPAATGEFPGAYTDTPLKGIRKLIAERMTNALAVSAQLSYDISADAAGLLALRKKFKASPADLGYAGITLGDLVCFATVQVLRRHANLNAHLVEGGLRTFESVHLGLAVDTPRGLLVPTIRHADRLSVRELSNATKELAEQARSGKIDPDLLAGATFTVSNLGSFGVESFTPIINVPQTGILGVNTISPRAVVGEDGTVGVQQRMGFSLTADHQVVDGADAGRFLADLVQAIEHIDLTVMG